MKKIVVLASLFVLNAFGADEFWAQLTPEERITAGVAGLTTGQRAALDQLANRFAREGARQAATVATEKARTEAKAELAKQIAQREIDRAGRTDETATPAIIHSRIAGDFKGWSGRTLFRLENGQSWVQANAADTYWIAPMANPEVEVRPAGFGSWKMFVLPANRWVRVRRVN